MARFMTWYSTGEYGKLYFEADTPEQAQELLEQVQQGELDITELPNHYIKIKGGDGFEFENLEEIDK